MEGSKDKYKTTREIIGGDSKGEGEFGGIRGSIEVEGGYNIKVKEVKNSSKNKIEKQAMKEIQVRPYGGIRGVVVKTEGFKETGTHVLRLEVKENNYVRTTIRTGIGIKGEGEVIKWAIGGGIECCAMGRYNEIKSVIIGEKEEFKARSVEEGIIKGEGNVRVEYEMTKQVGAYIDGRIGIGSGYNDISGNVGVRYTFGG